MTKMIFRAPISQAGRKTRSLSTLELLWYAIINLLRSSQAARRDQNRIAQREFRLRKQQRVRWFVIIFSTTVLSSHF